MSYGDGGPQIQFSTEEGTAQDGALIYTDHDAIGSGVSLSFVSNQSDAFFIAPHVKALTGFIGGTLDASNYRMAGSSNPQNANDVATTGL